MLPHLNNIELFILSVGSMVELAELEVGITATLAGHARARTHAHTVASYPPAHSASLLPYPLSLTPLIQGLHELIPSAGTPLHNAEWRELMAKLRTRWGIKRLAVCFKSRDEAGLQRRWSGTSVMAEEGTASATARACTVSSSCRVLSFVSSDPTSTLRSSRRGRQRRPHHAEHARLPRPQGRVRRRQRLGLRYHRRLYEQGPALDRLVALWFCACATMFARRRTRACAPHLPCSSVCPYTSNCSGTTKTATADVLSSPLVEAIKQADLLAG